MRKIYFILLAILVSLCLCSCKAKVDLMLQKDGSVDIVFQGGAGDAFTKMILSAAGGEEAFDINSITEGLTKSGFENVTGKVNGISDIRISFTDKNASSFLFNSGLLKKQNENILVQIGAKELKNFYSMADEQVQMILDLFLAPVFNDEVMTESEYIDLLKTFYGADAGTEVENSYVDFNIKNYKGNTKIIKYTIPELMCSN